MPAHIFRENILTIFQETFTTSLSRFCCLKHSSKASFIYRTRLMREKAVFCFDLSVNTFSKTESAQSNSNWISENQVRYIKRKTGVEKRAREQGRFVKVQKNITPL